MKSKVMIIAAILAMALIAGQAMANTTLLTVTGTDAAGDPIAASAKFTTALNTVTVDIWNTQANPTDVGQDISDLGFVLTSGQTTGSISSFSALERTIGAGGTYSGVAATTSHWGLDTGVSFGAFGTGLELTDFTGSHVPNTIIGPPAGTNLYSAANASFNAGGHDPEWFGTATAPVEFVLHVAGVTADSSVNFAQFSFGTEAGDNHNASVPIPPSALLLGSGLLGLGLVGWRRQ